MPHGNHLQERAKKLLKVLEPESAEYQVQAELAGEVVNSPSTSGHVAPANSNKKKHKKKQGRKGRK